MSAILGDQFNNRSNSLNLLRLIFAVLVIISHSFPLSGWGVDPQIGGMNLGTFAVAGFFTISGYLITWSRYNISIKSFLWRRVIRIFPGYWVVLLFTAFIASPLAGLVHGGWSFTEGLNYFVHGFPMFFGGIDQIGSTLDGNPYSYGWNVNLWTLRYEMFFYIALGLTLLIGYIRKKKSLFLFAYCVATIVSIFSQNLQNVSSSTDEFLVKPTLLLTFFLAGSVLFLYRETIPLNWWGFSASLIVLSATYFSLQGKALSALPMAYLIFWIASKTPTIINKISSVNDFSYGMYLYSFPIQQVLAAFGVQGFGIITFIIASVLVPIPFAIFSWFLVEKPSQKLKKLF